VFREVRLCLQVLTSGRQARIFVPLRSLWSGGIGRWSRVKGRRRVSEATLRRSAKDRSPAFDAEALEHLGALQALSRRLASSRTEADDLVQDAYVHAFNASERFTPGTNLRAWLRTILTNLAKNRRRDHSRSRIQTNEEAVARAADSRVSEQASPEQLLANDRVGPHIQAALESMPKPLRDAVWLRDVEEFSYADIARRQRVPLGTVMSRISRGRGMLYEKLLASEQVPPGRMKVRQ
jgi:RNA polymerase sigma-70 factor (ECF subfamily)